MQSYPWDDQALCRLFFKASSMAQAMRKEAINTIAYKADCSVVTEADYQVNQFLQEHLADLFPSLPLILEETAASHALVLDGRATYGLIDPIDGTKGYLKEGGSYSINFGIVSHGKAVAGIVAVPTQNAVYVTKSDGTAHRLTEGGGQTKLQVKKPLAPYHIITSAHHQAGKTADYIEQRRDIASVETCSGAYKFCAVAEGAADFYPRFAPSMQWDVAAGDAVLQAAGGSVRQMNKERLVYGTSLINSAFIATSHIDAI